MHIEFIIIFCFSLLFIWLVKRFAVDLGLVDIPNERSIHSKQTPSGAGIGFFLAVALILPCYHFNLLYTYLWTLVAIFFIFIVGVLDDHRDASPNTKFVIIIFSTIFLSFDSIVIRDLGSFFGFQLSLGWFALPFTIFAVVGFTNALNLIDGLDGLSATISMIILLSFFLLGYEYNDLFMMLISGSFIASLLAFLVFNWHPASIFMGDSGSLTLGFVIAMLAIKSLAYLPAISIFFVAAIPILDTLIVMIRRKRSGRSMVAADKCHLHHILKEFFSHNTPRTVFFLGTLQTIYSLVGLNLDKDIDGGYMLILFLLTLVLFYILFGTMIKRQNRKC